MKQTNNAIKFLMAQYRAIFRNANLKMFLAAATAAAAMAAGSAQADDLSGKLTNDASTAVDIVSSKAGDTLTAAGGNNYANSITVQKDADLTVSGSVSSLGDVTLNGGKLIIKDKASGLFLGEVKVPEGSTAQDKFQHYEHSLKATAGSTIELNSGNIGLANFDIAGSTISLKAGGDGGTNLTAYGVGAYQGKDRPYFKGNAVGVLTDVKATLEGGTNITSIGVLTVNGSSTEKSVFELQGIAAPGGDQKHETNMSYLEGSRSLTIDKTTINAKGTVAGSKGAALASPNLKITNSKLNVADTNDVLTVGSQYDRGSAAGETMNSYKAGTTVISNTDISVNKGTLNFGHDNGTTKSLTTFTLTGNKVDNKGVINTYGKLEVDTLKGWFGNDASKADSKLVLSGSTLTLTSDESLDLTTANISGSAGSAIVADKSTVTLATGFESKAPNVTANTIIAKGAKPASGEPLAQFPSSALRKIMYVKSGSVTALNELKADPLGGEILVYKAGNTVSSLTLGDEHTTNGKLTGFTKVLLGANLANKDLPGSLDINGKWDFGGARLTVSNTSTVDIDSNAVVNNISALQVGGPASTAVNIDGTVSIGRLLGAQGTGDASQINVSGTLNITGDGKDDKSLTKPGEYANDVQLKTATLNINAGGKLELTTEDAWEDVLKVTTDEKTKVSTFTVKAPGGNTTDDGGWVKDKVNLNGGGTLRIDLSGYNIGTKKALDDLAKSLISSTSKGMVDLGNIGFELTKQTDGSVNLADMPNVKTETTKNVVVNIKDTETNLTGSLSMGSASVAGNNLTTAEGSTLEFSNAQGGQFATNTTKGATDKTVSLTLKSGSALVLNGNGSIGDIKKNGTDAGTVAALGGANGTQTVGVVDVADVAILGGNVTAKSITAAGDTSVDGMLTVEGNISTKTLDVGLHSSINAKGHDIVVSGNGGTDEAFIRGNVEANSLTLSGDTFIGGNAHIDLKTLTGNQNKTIQVGEDAEGGLGATVVTDVLNLNSGSIFVDPSYGNPAALVLASNLANAQQNDAGVLNGDVYVGKNAAMGIGFDTEAEFKGSLAQYLDAKGSFSDAKGNVKNALVINDNITIASGNGIVLDADLTTDKLPSSKKGDTVVIGAGSNLIITTDALKGSAAAVTFKQNGTVSGAGTITLAGDLYSGSVDLKTVKLFAPQGASLTVSGDPKVVIADGLYSGALNADGTIKDLKLVEAKKNEVLAQTSAPVGQFVLDYTGQKLDVTAENKVLNSLIDDGNWAGVDAAAHAATYAGAQQAAVAAVTTMAEAVGGRVGSMGVEATAITATGSAANGGVWVAPMYKSVDADGFGAQGVSYGADVDLAGVAFGADTVNGNMRFGAVFNIGSGDSDGKVQGNGLKDEFDYYGFGIYSVMGFGQLALVGDASLNVISHDVEGLGLKGSADTTAVTMGVTGQYTISNPMVDVTPHLGARFIRLDTDSYDLTSANGVVATTDFEVQNVFSVPLGVTLSKAFEMGGWSFAPSADLTITFNAGDTEADSTTRFAGVSQNIGLSTEVLDEVTYGVAVGVGAQYGAFGTNIGINYTGSENTDSFGVNAQARYMF